MQYQGTILREQFDRNVGEIWERDVIGLDWKFTLVLAGGVGCLIFSSVGQEVLHQVFMGRGTIRSGESVSKATSW